MKYCILRSVRVKTEANTHTFLDWMIQIYYIERACNPKSQIPTIFSTFFKSQKWSAQNEAIFGGQNQKNAKKNFKNFYCPKSSEISYRSIIYL